MKKKVDWHIHSIDHTYFYGEDFVRLTEKDKSQIRHIVEWAADRGLDYAVITDHDLVEPSLYAAQYAKEYSDIEIIHGIECEIIVPHPETPNGIYVHILGVGVQEQPDYVKSYTVEKVVKAIHNAGGIAVMAHPVAYPPHIFHNDKHLLDGVEIFNGTRGAKNSDPFNPQPDAGRFDPGSDFKGICVYGSDHHYSHNYIRAQHQAVSEHEEEMIRKIINGEYCKTVV